MGINCGIVGLPNVGKSTLFNALTKTQNAEASNYPFCTIEPNVSKVAIPDQRLDLLSRKANSKNTIHAQIEFVDIAGLVKGASDGEGLGNQFLGNIRQVDVIIHVVRCYEDEDIIHVDGSIDPVRDIDVINTELLLADISTIQKAQAKLVKKAKIDKSVKQQLDVLKHIEDELNNGTNARDIETEESHLIEELGLLTAKPVLYVANVSEVDVVSGNSYTNALESYVSIKPVTICAKIEEEISALEDEDDRVSYLEMLNLKEPGLHNIIRASKKLLNLITYYTVGPKEARAWPILCGTQAPQAAGVIHTDFEKGFIKAEVTKYDDYVQMGEQAKESGKVLLKGRDYIVEDGDIILFRFNVS